MLLNHRSGLPNYLNFSETYWAKKTIYMNNEDVLAQLQKFKPKSLAYPNTKFYYNNTNYVLLALIIEKASGYSYKDFMHQFIFNPLGMHDTHVFDPKNQGKNEVLGYKGSSWKEDNIVYTDGVVGDKGIYSTVLDLYKWDQVLYAGKLIKPEILNLAYTPQSFEKPGNKNYGLGWRMTDQEDGTRIIYHNGWWHSFNSVFNRKISDGTCIIVLSNHYSQSVYKIKEIWDILYPNQDVDMSSEQ
jgi:CubicO group peptidase (beta-lactamase class C family)